MKRWLTTALMLGLLIFGFAIPASAQSSASRIDSYCTINADGDCMVNLTVTLHLEGDNDNLSFPLPVNARGITLNKASVRTIKTDSAIYVDISRLVSGLSGDSSMQFD